MSQPAPNLPQPAPAPAKRRRRWLLRAVAALVLLTAVASAVVAVLVGWNLTHPEREEITIEPESYGVTRYDKVEFRSREDQVLLRGWYVPAEGAPSDRTVILAHGYAGNRHATGTNTLVLARVLPARGYNVLLFDFRGSGESEGEEVTVGYKEFWDLAGAVDFTRERGARKVALIGFSMGGATALLTAARLPEVDAVAADSPFSDFRAYFLENASVWTKLPDFPFTYVIYATIPRMLGANLDTMSPLREMDALAKKPLLLIHGEKDESIDVHHSRDLLKAYEAHGGTRGSLWLVPKAGHVASFKTMPIAYLDQIQTFLDRHLK